MNNSELAHKWAQQNKASGKGDSMFFEGPSIYSYGRHFEIARFVDAETVLFTNRDYSVSTSQHKTRTWSAITHKRVFIVPSFNHHPDNLKYYQEKIEMITGRATRAISNTKFYLNNRLSTISDLQNYIDYFTSKIGAKSTIGKISGKHSRQARAFLEKVSKIDLSAEREKAKKFDAERRKKEAIKIAERAKLEAEHLEKWKNGENSGFHFSTMALRVCHFGDDKKLGIETTKGASVPMPEAVNLYRAIKSGEPVHGLKIGDYTVISLGTDNIKIGCHDISLTEIERIADVLGLNKTTENEVQK